MGVSIPPPCFRSKRNKDTHLVLKSSAHLNFLAATLVVIVSLRLFLLSKVRTNAQNLEFYDGRKNLHRVCVSVMFFSRPVLADISLTAVRRGEFW